VFLAR
jgi:hypothetical protein